MAEFFSHFYTLEIFNTRLAISQFTAHIHASGKSVGFVPTMGALHEGHISLIKQALAMCDTVICSIFVNPTQFNDPNDLEKYPRPLGDDIEKLKQAGCHALFNPPVEEIYAENEQWHLDIGRLENLLEGRYRPGHYQGVMQVVHKLFDIVKPDVAFFGQKDYQQYLVINKMISLCNLPVKLVMCPIKRDADGLALSSRNVHLSAAEHQHALILSQSLKQALNNFKGDKIENLTQQAKTAIAAQPGVELDYFEFADAETLEPANQYTKKLVALTAAKVGNTRLIDNMLIENDI